VTATCPNGHSSQATDYCDLCGVRIGPAPAAALQTSILPVIEEIGTSPAARAQPCPDCGAPRSGGGRYCEGCGHDFVAPAPSERAWEVVVTTDRARWERQRAPGISFPEPVPERRFKLDGAEMRIGRLQAGGERPEIAPDDPAISRLHAVLERQTDGAYALRDLKSTNGTTLNDDPRPVSGEVAVRLADGDRIQLGAWTTITVRAAE
jgi:FHA domain-containing protein